MAMILVPSNNIKERLTIFGREGSGKSSIILQVLEKVKGAKAHIIDLDYSMSYERLIALEHPDVEDRAIIYPCGAVWDEFAATMLQIVEEGDMDTDWLVIDPTTITWQMVQSWFSEQVHGSDIASHMVRLRAETAKEADPIKAFNKELTSDMTWPIINKLYQEKFYGLFRQWKSHSIMVCEAQSVRKDADEAERKEFGFLGVKPAGQKSIPYVGATNIFVEQFKQGEHRFTTTKDRGRTLVEKQPYTDFAEDYLVEVANWEWERA